MKQELIGLSVIEELVLKCGDCGTPLINIVLSETNESRQKRNLKPLSSSYKVVNCYKCCGSSFQSKIFDGSVSISSFSDKLDIDLEDTDIRDNVIYSTLKVYKKV
jgi:hypothetical protein